MKKIIIVFVTLILFSGVAYGVSGHVSIEYDTINQIGMTEVDLNKEIINNWTLGIQMNTYLGGGIIFKNRWMPTGSPTSQFYRGYLEYEYNENITFSISNQCRHFFSQSNISKWNDSEGIVVGGKYEF